LNDIHVQKGRIKISNTISRLIISNPTDIKGKIIPLFDKYPLLTEFALSRESC